MDGGIDHTVSIEKNNACKCFIEANHRPEHFIDDVGVLNKAGKHMCAYHGLDCFHTSADLDEPDIFVGGFPCPPFSHAVQGRN